MQFLNFVQTEIKHFTPDENCGHVGISGSELVDIFLQKTSSSRKHEIYFTLSPVF